MTSVEWQAGEDVAPLERVAAVIVAPVQGNVDIVAADLPSPTGSARAMRPRQNRHAETRISRKLRISESPCNISYVLYCTNAFGYVNCFIFTFYIVLLYCIVRSSVAMMDETKAVWQLFWGGLVALPACCVACVY